MEKKMAAVCLVLALSLLLTGCGQDKGATAGGEDSGQAAVSAGGGAAAVLDGTGAGEAAGMDNGDCEAVFDKDIVSQMFSEDGTLRIYGEYEFPYSYQIPVLTAKTSGAEAANVQIHRDFDGVVSDLADCKAMPDEERYEPAWYEISYDEIWNGSIVSLLVASRSCYDDYVDYHCYNYDAGSGAFLTAKDLLARRGMDAGDLDLLLKATAVRECDRIHKPYLEAEVPGEGETEEGGGNDLYRREAYAEYLRDRMATIQVNHADGEGQLYLDEEGCLCALATVGVMAGSGFYNDLLPLVDDVSVWEDLKKVDVPEDYRVLDFNRKLFGIYGEEGYGVTVVHHTDAGGSYESTYYLGFDTEDPSVFLYQDAIPDAELYLDYTGRLELAGMDEDGFLFEYEMETLGGKELEPGNRMKGGFYFYAGEDYDSEEYRFVGHYKWVSGDDLLDSQGAELELTQTFG